MEIVVKAFSRPFYLDRCLLSIRSFIDGYDGVTVLDDGLLPADLQHLQSRHPDVRFVSAPWAETKAAVVRRRLRQPLDDPPSSGAVTTAGGSVSLNRILVWPGGMDPLVFWTDAIGAMTASHILLLEEDTWITGNLDLARLQAGMEAANCLAAAVYFTSDTSVGQVSGSLPVGEVAQLELIDVPLPPRRDIADTYFPVSLALLRRDYWLAATAEASSWLPESPIHDRAVAVVADMVRRGETPRFGRISPAVLAHGFSLSTRVPPEQYGTDISLYDISDLLSLIWREGGLDPMHDFPEDFSEKYLSGMISARLGGEAAGEWLRLRRTYEASYAMGLHRKAARAAGAGTQAGGKAPGK